MSSASADVSNDGYIGGTARRTLENHILGFGEGGDAVAATATFVTTATAAICVRWFYTTRRY